MLTMLLGSSAIVLAEEITLADIDQKLMERGYPQIVLDTMDSDAKLDIYMDDVTFAGAVISYYNEEESTFTDIRVNEDGTYIAPRGQISTSNLSLSFTYSKQITSGRLQYLKVTYSYKWLKLPINRYSDPIAVSWDSNKFEMIDESFSKVDKFDGYIVLNGETTGPYIGQEQSSEKGYAVSSADGVTWYADLKGYTGITVTKLYGSATFNLKPKVSTGTMTLYGHYVHQLTPLSVSINIDDAGSLSISGFGYDERGSQQTISW